MPEEPVLPSDPQPLPVNQPVPPVAVQSETSTTVSTFNTTGLPSNVAAGLSAIFLIVGSIVFLILEKKDTFVRFWAMQSLIFGGGWFVLRVAIYFVGVILYHIFTPFGWMWGLLALVVNLGLLIVWIISIVQAFNGKRWELPFIGPIAKEQLARLTPRL